MDVKSLSPLRLGTDTRHSYADPGTTLAETGDRHVSLTSAPEPLSPRLGTDTHLSYAGPGTTLAETDTPLLRRPLNHSRHGSGGATTGVCPFARVEKTLSTVLSPSQAPVSPTLWDISVHHCLRSVEKTHKFPKEIPGHTTACGS